MKIRGLYLLGLSFFLLASCSKEEDPINKLPDTKIFLGEINLSGEQRLTSQVEIFWSGYDADGFITGYELSINGGEWTYTTSSDSVFKFAIGAETDTPDIDLRVRAIDNLDKRDPEPAFLRIPVKNTPPTIEFNRDLIPEDSTWILLSLLWLADDLDGVETIDSVSLKFNDGPWYNFNSNLDFVSLVPEDPQAEGSTPFDLYLGLDANPYSGTINGLELNNSNIIYIRAKDVAGSYSVIDTLEPIFIKKQNSDLLVVDAGSAIPRPRNVWLPMINQIYSNGADYISLVDYGGNYVPAFWNPTFDLLISQYDKVFLNTDAAELNGALVLEQAADAIQKYLNNDGKMLISTSLPFDIREGSAIFSFSPMDSLSSSEGQARLVTDSQLVATANAMGYEALTSSAFIVGADPFYAKTGAEVLFTAQLTRINGWSGPNNAIAKSRNSEGNTNQVFSSFELHLLNKDEDELKTFFDQVLNEEFDW